jgi:hypothetical protein
MIKRIENKNDNFDENNLITTVRYKKQKTKLIEASMYSPVQESMIYELVE